MAIRITGMYSGLDTESIIGELASAQSMKKNKLVKAQMKLSWKQDAWKALNTKIFSFYTNVLGNMRFEGSYMKKATKVSSSAVSVVTTADAPNSVQTMTVDKLAKQGYLTGGALTQDKDGKKVTASTTLEQLGFTGDSNGEGKFRVKVGNATTDITVTKDMKISDVVKKLQSAGVNASFDAKNQRFYVNAKNSGANADFTITSNDAGGQEALSTLKLMAAYDPNSNEYKEYQKWAGYASAGRADAEYEEAAKRAAARKASTDSLLKTNETLQKRLDALRKANSERDTPYDEKTSAADLYDQLYGPEHEVEKKDADGNVVMTEKLDADGNPVIGADGNPEMVPVMVKVRDGGINSDLGKAKKALEAAKKALEDGKKDGTLTADEIAQLEQDIVTTSENVSNLQKKFNEVSGEYSYMKSVEDTQAAIDKNNATIDDNKKYYELDADGKLKVDADGKVVITADQQTEVTNYFTDKIAAAQQYLADAAAATDAEKDAMAKKVDGRDAEITLNDVTYTNSTNTFTINGLTITAQQETKPGEEITLTTAEDADGIYDMIKNFFTEYNKLINEMDGLYNADSSKGYEPLLSEEKNGLADAEIEEWEKKIKDSLLRRDSTLRDVTDAIKTVMLQGATVNGKKMYLSDFGINTLGFFNAADNEKGAYHIDGDKDDATVANNDETLKNMIASDPETVQKFFAGLSKNLYDKLTDKMKAVKDTSSAFTVYNDKTMQKEYDDYKDKIKKEETKLNDLIDNWYKKFSAMETAMAKLQSKNNAVSGMFGG
ncbi:MAG: flagellar filament capping protein FliD [Lachnospiraceae bacterium]